MLSTSPSPSEPPPTTFALADNGLISPRLQMVEWMEDAIQPPAINDGTKIRLGHREGGRVALGDVNREGTRAVLADRSDPVGALRLVDVETGMLSGAMLGLSASPSFICFSHDSYHILAGGDDGSVALFDLFVAPEPPSRRLSNPPQGFTRVSTAREFLTTPEQLPLGPSKNPLYRNARRRVFDGFRRNLESIEGIPQFSNLPQIPCTLKIKDHTMAITTATFHPYNHSRWMTGSDDKMVYLYESAVCGSFTEIVGKYSFPMHHDAVSTLAFHPQDTELFATATMDSLVHLYGRCKGEKNSYIALLMNITENNDPVLSLTWSLTGDRLLMSGLDSAVRIFQMPKPDEHGRYVSGTAKRGEEMSMLQGQVRLVVTLYPHCEFRNILSTWCDFDDCYFVTASNDAAFVWAQGTSEQNLTTVRPYLMQRLRAPKEVMQQNVLRSIYAHGIGVKLVYVARKYGPQNLVKLNTGCALVEHRYVSCLYDCRFEIGFEVARVLYRLTGFVDLPLSESWRGTIVSKVIEFVMGTL